MLETADNLEIGFWMCAVAGTLLFALKALMSIMGGMEHGLDVESGHPNLAHEGIEGSDAAFKLFSINSLTGFFMMFGWTGLSCYKQFGMGAFASFACATAIGVFTMYVTGLLFKGASMLVSQGSQFSVEKAIGKVGTVYQRIPANGRGRIQMNIEGATHEIDAVSESKCDIESHKNIKVVRVIDSRTVSVKAAE